MMGPRVVDSHLASFPTFFWAIVRMGASIQAWNRCVVGLRVNDVPAASRFVGDKRLNYRDIGISGRDPGGGGCEKSVAWRLHSGLQPYSCLVQLLWLHSAAKCRDSWTE
jgi:hypothetical protein